MDDQDYWLIKLNNQRAELMRLDENASESRKSVELDQTKVGRLSRMDALQEQAMNNAVSERRKAALMRIEAAHARIKEGEFGYCVRCGDEIDQKRLELDASIAICGKC